MLVEHRLARLVQLGIRQSRYFGRVKTRFQLYLADTVANPTLVAAKASLTVGTGDGSSVGTPCAQRPSVPPLTSSLRVEVKSCPWPCLRRPHCRNSSHSSPRKRLSGQISSPAISFPPLLPPVSPSRTHPLGGFGLSGVKNIAAALRHYSCKSWETLTLLGLLRNN